MTHVDEESAQWHPAHSPVIQQDRIAHFPSPITSWNFPTPSKKNE